MGAEALCETISQIAAGTLTAVPQDHENATLAPMLNKEMAEFHLTDICRPYPQLGARHESLAGRMVHHLRRQKAQGDVLPRGCRHGEAPGTVLATKPLTVACGEGAIQLLEVVPEGKKPMDGTAFAAGLRLKTGDSL